MPSVNEQGYLDRVQRIREENSLAKNIVLQKTQIPKIDQEDGELIISPDNSTDDPVMDYHLQIGKFNTNLNVLSTSRKIKD